MASTLKTVDKVTITFLVDNCIEWMTKLPPGFSHELLSHTVEHPHYENHLHHEVPVLDFNHFCCGAHGFAALIETHTASEPHPRRILFDTGPNASTLVGNMKALHVDSSTIESVVLSHWHVDHSGGMLSFLNARRARLANAQNPPKITVDLHPARPLARGIAPPPGYRKVIAALAEDPKFEEIEAAGGTVEKHKEGHTVAGGSIWVSGEVPRVSNFEGGVLGGRTWVVDADDQGRWIKDEDIMDERYAAIEVAGKGLIVFSACSHAGIVNVLKDAVATFKRPIYMVIGGFHLAGPELLSRIPPTIDFMRKELNPPPKYILPMHCSGFACKIALEKAFGEGCVPAGVGMRVVVEKE